MSGISRRTVLKTVTAGAASLCANTSGSTPVQAERATDRRSEIEWHRFPDSEQRFAIDGLPFFSEFPDHRLWRLPRAAYSDPSVPRRVIGSSKTPAGGRIRFRSNTTRLHVEVTTTTVNIGRYNMSATGSHGLNVYVDGSHWATAVSPTTAATEILTLFDDASQGTAERSYEIALPLARELTIGRIGLSKGASLLPPHLDSKRKTLMVYGSSIAQGSGACRAAMSYGAILARTLHWDYVNFGFGGAGKGEPSVVRHITKAPPPSYLILDVGLSFYQSGTDDLKRYTGMLEKFRTEYPETHIVCTQPILGPARHTKPDCVSLQKEIAGAAAGAVSNQRNRGDGKTFLIDGNNELLDASRESDSFHELLHPNDLGYWRIAERLSQKLTGWGIA